MNNIEAFKKLRDICDEIIIAHENENEKELESAIGRFIYLCMQLQSNEK